MVEAYALVIWYMTQNSREYGAMTFQGRGEIVEMFAGHEGLGAQNCPPAEGSSQGFMCPYAEFKCETRKAEIMDELRVGKSLIDRYVRKYTVMADKPFSFDCVAIKTKTSD
jgi:hypothetical protein